MSTNYYARVRLSADHGITTTVTMHIGKTGSGTILSGIWFQSFADWEKFLRYNTDKLDVIDEYDAVILLDDLIDMFRGYEYDSRRRQFDAICKDHTEYADKYWLDPEGFTFCNVEFS